MRPSRIAAEELVAAVAGEGDSHGGARRRQQVEQHEAHVAIGSSSSVPIHHRRARRPASGKLFV
jgi:hypothetical protein